MLPMMQRISHVQCILPIKSMACKYILHFDGCCKGNPGESGAGVVIYKDDEEIWSSSRYLGKGTNNQAEYKALIIGLEKAVELCISELYVFGDSQLVINQVSGAYKVSSPQIKPLYEKVKEVKEKFKNILEKAPDGIFIAVNNIIKFANTELSKIVNLKIGGICSEAFANRDFKEKILGEIEGKSM